MILSNFHILFCLYFYIQNLAVEKIAAILLLIYIILSTICLYLVDIFFMRCAKNAVFLIFLIVSGGNPLYALKKLYTFFMKK